MDYQWDPQKASKNYSKHRISFADAVAVFADDRSLTIEDDYPDEERLITIGADAFGRVLVVVYAYREDGIRIISARKANARERKQYEEE
ncbi:MAG TPA: BrnT family toxin [Anaerolineales bacterium]|jgi:hypothetical protein